MRKAILVVAALMLVFSGVAAVSAYEAHIINVKAKVENALEVSSLEIDFGTVFPQEWLIEDREISLSESAEGELGLVDGGLRRVRYEIFAEYKVKGAGPVFYEWLGEYLWVGINAADPSGASMAGWTRVGSEPDPSYSPDHIGIPDPMAKGTGLVTALNIGNTSDTLRVMLLAPAFHGYYNADTDVKPDWWPTLANWPLLPQIDHDGVELGLDLKVQVTDIVRWTEATLPGTQPMP